MNETGFQAKQIQSRTLIYLYLQSQSVEISVFSSQNK